MKNPLDGLKKMEKSIDKIKQTIDNKDKIMRSIKKVWSAITILIDIGLTLTMVGCFITGDITRATFFLIFLIGFRIADAIIYAGDKVSSSMSRLYILDSQEEELIRRIRRMGNVEVTLTKIQENKPIGEGEPSDLVGASREVTD